jgi:hypothetical protein
LALAEINFLHKKICSRPALPFIHFWPNGHVNQVNTWHENKAIGSNVDNGKVYCKLKSVNLQKLQTAFGKYAQNFCEKILVNQNPHWWTISESLSAINIGCQEGSACTPHPWNFFSIGKIPSCPLPTNISEKFMMEKCFVIGWVILIKVRQIFVITLKFFIPLCLCIIQGVSKKTLRKFNRLLCITNLTKQFNFYIGRKSCYLAFLWYLS